MNDLSVTLGRLKLQNPILVASGTFGYAREMAGVVDFAKLGGIIPKTVTRQVRAGNRPPWERSSGHHRQRVDTVATVGAPGHDAAHRLCRIEIVDDRPETVGTGFPGSRRLARSRRHTLRSQS